MVTEQKRWDSLYGKIEALAYKWVCLSTQLILVFFFSLTYTHIALKFQIAEMGGEEGKVSTVGMAGMFNGFETLGSVLLLSSMRHD